MRAVTYLRETIANAISTMGLAWPTASVIEPPKNSEHGDLAANCAMLLARDAGRAPRDIATDIAALIAQDEMIISAEVAGPGFLNVRLAPAFWAQELAEVFALGTRYGRLDVGEGQKVQVEFVSANPTGPLHIGHGRGAALGDSLARLLAHAGYDVTAEYYVNDAGRQMRILGVSVWVRYQQLHGRDVDLPEEAYVGDYIKDVATRLSEARGTALLELDEEAAIDACYAFGMQDILDGIKADLQEFRVHHDVWFSEKSLVDGGTVARTLDWLLEQKLAYEKDGALWFESTRFGDDKDRVLRKSSDDLTYFASDIAYHKDKYDRGFSLVVDVWGADHHGYVPRMRAAVQALGRDPKQDFDVMLVQLVNLLRGGEKVFMSTRAGTFETLADVVAEVGTDAARFMFLSRKSDAKLDFDLDLVKQQSMDNPVYYVQYAHARIHSVMTKARDTSISVPDAFDPTLGEELSTEADLALIKTIARFPSVIEAGARTRSPHHVSFYLRELASELHRYYNVNKVVDQDAPQTTRARLMLLACVATVLQAGLAILGVSAPESM